MQQAYSLNNGGLGPQRYHRIDEICVAVSEPTPPEMDVQAAAKARYEPLRMQLRDGLKTIAGRPQARDVVRYLHPDLVDRIGVSLPQDLDPDLASVLVNELTPYKATWDYIKTDPEILYSHLVPPPEDVARKIARNPWIVLPTNTGSDEEKTGNTKTVYFYKVNIDPLDWSDTDRLESVRRSGQEPREQRIRNLVRLIHLDNRRQRHLSSEAKESITAFPNWLTTAVMGGPSPGSRPEPLETGDVPPAGKYWSFQFGPDSTKVVAPQRGLSERSNVIIAILDTSPAAGAINAALSDRECPQQMRDNELLRKVNAAVGNDLADLTVPKIVIDDPKDLSIPEADFNALGVRVDWRNVGTAAGTSGLADPFLMDDHGLFVTGIIHDIAPMAETHLIRVLGGYGVSDIRTVLHVLENLPNLIAADPNKRLVVNMSLGFSIPPGVEVLRLWLEQTFTGMEAEFGKSPDLQTALAALEGTDPVVGGELAQIVQELQTGVSEMITFLQQHGRILVVAAAGNDNRWVPRLPKAKRDRPEPRWPARYDSVLGVAAVGLNDQPAEYSNRGDATEIRNGIATYGGNAHINRSGELGAILTGSAQVDAVKGIYLSKELTMATNPRITNQSGWVYWSGTSFATPVIAGLAADLWDQRQKESGTWLKHEDVVAEVVKLQTGGIVPGTDTIDCPTIHAEQKVV